MSLRFRLIGAVSALLLVTLVLGGALACWRAYASVETEMRGAMAGAQDVAREALGRHGDDVGPAFVPDLVLSFNGQRHVQAEAVLSSGAVWVASHTLVADDPAPDWFRGLIGVRPQAVRIALPAPRGAALVLSTDPSNEIAEVWRQTRDAFAALLLFCGGACIAIHLIVGHTLRRFAAFDTALKAIADGRHDTALGERGPPEFVALARGFNRMAGRIRDFQQCNRDLREQILTLQAEERAEIARDLHDEVGPYLFAINVDAGDIPRLLREQDVAEVAERAGAIREAAVHIQKHVRAILRQLRPNDALAFGLEAAIGDLVAFWARRCPDTAFAVTVDLGDLILERRIEDVAYRLVQESISNAVRHGRPKTITVEIGRCADACLSVAVTDDGRGLAEAGTRSGVGLAGMGLAGMAERVRALHGDFNVGAADAGGVRTVARVPLQARTPTDLALA
jgi:two-component system sensor histidine kinase UhpB